jgi:hypothetical protein
MSLLGSSWMNMKGIANSPLSRTAVCVTVLRERSM